MRQDFDRPPQLPHEGGDDLHAERIRIFNVEAGWQARAVVAVLQDVVPVLDPERDDDVVRAVLPAVGRLGKGVLDAVHHQFVDDQAGEDALVDIEVEGIDGEIDAEALARFRERKDHGMHQFVQVLAEVGVRQVVGLVEFFMHHGHGADPRHGHGEQLLRRGIADIVALELEEARDHLQVVLDPVVQLAQEDALLLEGGLEPVLRPAPLVDLGQEGPVRILELFRPLRHFLLELIGELAEPLLDLHQARDVAQNDDLVHGRPPPGADDGEVHVERSALDERRPVFVLVERGVGFGEDRSQAGQERIERPADDGLGRPVEQLEGGGIGVHDLVVRVEDDEAVGHRLADGVLGERDRAEIAQPEVINDA